ncbi:S-DNA-T family DNA segregation ATPase FtsK/SpoIIIE [Sphingomonas vulcanisoli]|uniref:DNA translocase FtsK n=1 Tax=Sphingomonas vulcanisoli TaxID=1658060 RepID=A0ABX0TPH1_9SPHN|nr:DNA translocase FtsK 4TM domain-containing protein [Sphingomonas vulcanisoli]NIJ07397.1 S-DNA-T family DNA segregation ATPase FtsK/SpoIIIE [Sphingomonas vulcanisoli]
MATRLADGTEWRARAGAFGRRGGAMAGALAILALVLLLGFALASYHPVDPALNTAAGGPPANVLGTAGAWIADLLFTLFGVAALLLLPPLIVVALRLWRGVEAGRWKRALPITIVAMILIDGAVALVPVRVGLPLPAGLGGAIGIAAAHTIDLGLAQLRGGWADAVRIAAMLLLAIAGLACAFWAMGLSAGEREALFRRRERADGMEGDAPVLLPVERPLPRAARRKIEAAAEETPPPRTTIVAPVAALSGGRGQRERQAKLDLGDTWVLPTVDLLAPAPKSMGPQIDQASLDRNARLLETVLEDFHVRGHITHVRPGPVVTMYELEPAAGIKASRVTALSDDIARNMSALSARIATVPGRTVIGIELPNQKRESVVLSELVDNPLFDDHASENLPLILGKNIAGDAVIADLAPMPHLLVAGTTGSGKSVGLNSMILSLLYKLNPEQCRMIMIDPKMLELSVYDDIPHLLTPVVTDPPKAIRSLKWAVEQMEDRYRMMATIGVRSLASFNEKVRAAKAKGQPLGRRVQTGYDAETGQPIYEEEKLEFEPLFKIVVIIDELADLMMTAGKEVEFLIQRLAQKARAAGIHLIMATQRPSVDVITGVIKANLPTRISFSVTSKIDSRTILGEQGAEQLLGKGDMLYMPGGKQIIRVHGPFVSDEEVRAVAEHWKAQKAPEYISAVTEEPDDGGFALEGAPAGDDSPDAQLYRKAVQVVAESQKASTSYVQRQLRIGYNSAARLIDRMEKEGVVGSPDHVGRREVLVDRNGQPV